MKTLNHFKKQKNITPRDFIIVVVAGTLIMKIVLQDIYVFFLNLRFIKKKIFCLK